ncbi:hypothetical protein [Sessilibacter sp. MAH4]
MTYRKQSRWLLMICLVSTTGFTLADGLKTNNPDENCKEVIFSCVGESQRYKLCKLMDERFVFLHQTHEQIDVAFECNSSNHFEFSNYHRFKVNQNSLSFSTHDKKFELFDYYDEESQPPESEIGIVISDLEGNIEEEISCQADSVSNLVEFE